MWAFLGDGEMDEAESLGAIGLAAREELDNLTFVINCNLQRLDGPVRGNGKIIQELEAFFRGAGWNVIKVIWGRDWDPLLAADTDGALVNLMNTTPDGDYQTYKAEDGAFVREHFFGRDPRTRKMVEHLTDDEIWGLQRGGHDYRKMYAAYEAATEHTGQPTVILAKTIKGWTLGSHFEGRNATHQMKKLTADDLQGFRDRLQIPIADAQLDATLPPYYHPGADSEEHRVPARAAPRARRLPARAAARREAAGAAGRRRSTTSCAAAPASSRSPPRWRSSGCSRTCSRTRRSARGSCRSSRTRPAPSAWTRCSRSQKIYSPHGQRYTVGRPRADAVLQGVRDRASSCTRASTRPARSPR